MPDLTVAQIIEILKKLPPTCIVKDANDHDFAITNIRYDSLEDECFFDVE